MVSLPTPGFPFYTKMYIIMNDIPYKKIMKRIRELERMITALKREVELRMKQDGDTTS